MIISLENNARGQDGGDIMEPEQKMCKNEECHTILPDGYKRKYCPACRKIRAEKRNQTLTDLLCAPGVIAMSIATRGNRHYAKEEQKP